MLEKDSLTASAEFLKASEPAYNNPPVLNIFAISSVAPNTSKKFSFMRLLMSNIFSAF